MPDGWTNLYMVEAEDCIVCRYGHGRDPEGAVIAVAKWRAAKEIGLCQSHVEDLDRFRQAWVPATANEKGGEADGE